MSKQTNQIISERVSLVHDWLVRAGESVDAEQFTHVFSAQAPPIGWHLWHMTRFADRLQAKLGAVVSDRVAKELWDSADIAQKWGVDELALGVFASGMGQGHMAAQMTIAMAGQAAVIDYARDVFAVCNAAIERLADNDFDASYHGILDYDYDPIAGTVRDVGPTKSSVAQDLVFHVAHGSRHMGMIEALRGLLGMPGTLSI